MPKFDYLGAKKAGYSDQEIATYLTQQKSKGVDLYIDKNDITPQPTVPQGETAPVAEQVAVGAGKGVLSSARSTSGLLNKIKSYIPEPIKQVMSKTSPTLGLVSKGISAVEPAMSGLETKLGAKQGALTTPTTTGEKVGYYGEKVGEFLVPGVGGAKLAKPTVGEGFIKAGEKIQNIIIKPGEKALKEGFDIKNITKYDLAGPLDKALPKTTQLLKQKVGQLNEIIAQKKEVPTINLGTAIQELKNTFAGKGFKTLGQKTSVNKTIKTIENELTAINPNWKSEVVNFGDAIDAKRASGLNASFLKGQIKTGLTAEEKVWNNLYKILQRETEKAAKGTEFEKINKEISDIIPIEQAMIKRIPVEQRNSIISLTDMISFGLSTIEPRALALGVLNRITKSGTVASGLIKVGKKLK